MEYYEDKFAQEQREQADNYQPPRVCYFCHWFDYRCNQCLNNGKIIEDEDNTSCPSFRHQSY